MIIGSETMTTPEVCKALHISPATFYRHMDNGAIPHIHIGGMRKVPRILISKMLNGERVPVCEICTSPNAVLNYLNN